MKFALHFAWWLGMSSGEAAGGGGMKEAVMVRGEALPLVGK
jgi:hypothetical protein